MESKINYFEALNNLIGYGNMDAQYWVIGIEEGQSFNEKKNSCNEQFLNFYYNYYNYKKNPYVITNEDYDEKTFSCIDTKNTNYMKLLQYISKAKNIKDIGSKNVELFMLNLYPLASKGTSYDYDEKYYRQLFGIASIKEILW